MKHSRFIWLPILAMILAVGCSSEMTTAPPNIETEAETPTTQVMILEFVDFNIAETVEVEITNPETIQWIESFNLSTLTQDQIQQIAEKVLGDNGAGKKKNKQDAQAAVRPTRWGEVKRLWRDRN